jgi:hypothetical protein
MRVFWEEHATAKPGIDWWKSSVSAAVQQYIREEYPLDAGWPWVSVRDIHRKAGLL